MPGEHAKLSPSGASRWLACTPSAQFEQQFPDKAGEAADEGTHAHSLAELLLRYQLKRVTKAEFNKQMKALKDSKHYNEAMLEHCENYVTHVLERFAEAKKHTKDAVIYVEQRVDLTEFIPEGFGTSDSGIIADGVLDTFDLKYGKGVAVDALNNRQMMLYALGVLLVYDMLYDIRSIRMTIYQPRLNNVSVWTIEVEELRNWAINELRPKAALAFEGAGEYKPGDHCRFCRGKAQCKALADFNLEVAKHEFADANMLSDAELVEVLAKIPAFTSWLKAIEEHALSEALNNGKKWPGYKLVSGRSNRVYANETQVAEKLIAAGITEDKIYERSLLGITKLQKTIGKAAFAENVEPLLIKPPGKPTLVPDGDDRPEYSTAASAAADFEHISNN